MSPHAARGAGTRHTVETVERGRERGGRRTAWAMSCHAMKRKGMPPVRTPRYAMLQSISTWNSDTCANVSTPLTSRGTQALFVVNSVKLHLTGFKNDELEKCRLNFTRRPTRNIALKILLPICSCCFLSLGV